MQRQYYNVLLVRVNARVEPLNARAKPAKARAPAWAAGGIPRAIRPEPGNLTPFEASTTMQMLIIPIRETGMMEDHELRMTESRKAILSALECTRSHPTADEVYEIVREELPRVSLATVYRNLDLLAREGLVTVLSEAGEQRRYDVAGPRHHHVRCEVCGRLDDVALEDPDAVEEMLRDASGYEIHGYSLCFVGTCSRCSRKARTRDEPAVEDEKQEKVG